MRQQGDSRIPSLASVPGPSGRGGEDHTGGGQTERRQIDGEPNSRRENRNPERGENMACL